MTKYKFLYFKNNSFEIEKFVEKYGKSINRIVQSCFDIDFYDSYSWICECDTFYMIDEDSDDVVAFAETKYKKVINYNVDVEKYNIVKLNQNEWDKMDIQKRYVLVGPIIETLCRDSSPKYKGVGTIFLNNICEHYKNKGGKHIYIVPESSKYKVYGEDDCGVVLDRERYIDSQKKLQKYYEKFNFYEFKNHYEMDYCNRYSYSPVVFFPVYRKDL